MIKNIFITRILIIFRTCTPDFRTTISFNSSQILKMLYKILKFPALCQNMGPAFCVAIGHAEPLANNNDIPGKLPFKISKQAENP
jgi:hypothetical protein